MMSLGKEIKKARIDKGLRQGVLAQHAGVSQKYLSHIENDKADPSFRIVTLLARVLGVSLDQLACDETRPAQREA